MDAVLQETLRLVITFVALRRNLLEDLHVNGEVIAKGDFVTYLVAGVHLNPDIYTDPTTFDPERFSVGREEHKKQKYAFLGWGVSEQTFRLRMSGLLMVLTTHYFSRSSSLYGNESSEVGD